MQQAALCAHKDVDNGIVWEVAESNAQNRVMKSCRADCPQSQSLSPPLPAGSFQECLPVFFLCMLQLL